LDTLGEDEMKWFKGYSDKDIKSMQKRIDEIDINPGGLMEVTRRELRAYACGEIKLKDTKDYRRR
jgi:hypothetical protein